MGTRVLTHAGEAFQYRNRHLHCDDVSAERLVAEYGTPLYVYSETAIIERFHAFTRAFAAVDPLIAYSVKANGNLAVLQLLADAGAGADIVSGGELYRAQLAGIPAESIVFSGVGKTLTELAAALRAGIYAFNVESKGELYALSDLAQTMGERAPIALRVNPDVETATPHHYTATGHKQTKFGIPYDEAEALYASAAALPGIRVRGIDVHIGSQIVDPEPYRLAVARVLELVDRLRARGIDLEFIDMGGGFGVNYGADDRHSEPAVFAEAIVQPLRASGLRVLFEPGRYIVGPAGVLLTRVLYIKRMGGKTFVITDAGMNDLLRPSHYASYHRVEPALLAPDRPTIEVDVVGPICESGDFLALDRPIPRVEAGELLAIGTVGAYGFSMASTYNARPRPAEVMVAGASHRLIRRRENHDDLVRGEIEFLDH
ncbi:MAG TPA: diaminopimelate decarboxylase [Longimicrobiales bacterium]|nr:diaminopimelate decarboxylase [Longimicrobiales bacterium]